LIEQIFSKKDEKGLYLTKVGIISLQKNTILLIKFQKMFQ